jgi:hypothetical protein
MELSFLAAWKRALKAVSCSWPKFITVHLWALGIVKPSSVLDLLADVDEPL